MQSIRITSRDEGQRLDKLLAKFMPVAPKSFFYKMMRKKNIVLNGKKVAGMEKLVAGDEIKLFLADDTIAKFQGIAIDSDGVNDSSKLDQQQRQLSDVTDANVKLDVVFEDDDIVVINKPVDMLSQKANKDDVSLVEYLTAYLQSEGIISGDRGMTFKPGICNRLDRNTSGLIVAGKSVRGLQWMNQLFRERTLKKYYLCIVKGRIDNSSRIDGYLTKHANHNTVTISDQKTEDSVRIITEYEPLQHGSLDDKEYTLLKVHLVTGKSHQIRAHLKSINHPIVGDAKYGHKDVYQIFRKEFKLRHQLLHAWKLELDDTENVPEQYRGQKFSAELTDEFIRIIKGLGMKDPQ